MWNQKPREQRILERIQSIKKKTKKVVVRKPKKNLKDEKQLQKVEDIVFNHPKGLKKFMKLTKNLYSMK